MQEAGKKEKVETQLPHLWNPHKIRQDDLFRSKDGTSNRSRRTDRVKRSADLSTATFFHEQGKWRKRKEQRNPIKSISLFLAVSRYSLWKIPLKSMPHIAIYSSFLNFISAILLISSL